MARSALDEVRAKAAEIRDGWNVDKPTFSLLTGWSKTYDEMLDGTFENTVEEKDILHLALDAGRAILSGRGGSGKTWLLRRLYSRALDEGVVPVFIDLKQWSGADYDSWSDWTVREIGDGADFLLSRFGKLGLGAFDLDRLSPDIKKIIFVDGLNEIASGVGGEILVVLDEIVRNQMSTSVIVADRLIRRDLPNRKQWWIGTTLPLSPEEIRRHLGKNIEIEERDIRTSPFFLGVQIDGAALGERDAGRAAMLESWLQKHSDLSADDLRAASRAAFEMYTLNRSRSRIFERESFAKISGDETLTKLEHSGTIVSKDGQWYFDHHIAHDYLAARHLARLEAATWNPTNFRSLSFDGSSIDALELTFEQLDTTKADLFLRALYDWNLYASGYVLAQVSRSDGFVGKEMRTVIFAMLAEKRFDAILATRERAEDALRLIQLEDVRPFRDAKSISDICSAIVKIESKIDWFCSWRRLFCASQSGELPQEVLREIRNSDSIVGWTVANVIRRFAGIDWAVPELLKGLETEDNSTVRWRIAHILGKIPNETVAESLLSLIDHDQDIDVRFGAVRSLVEVSLAGDSELRDILGGKIEERAQSIGDYERLAGELRACLLVDPDSAPHDWIAFVRKCVRSQFLNAEKTSQKDIWRGCLFAAEDLYAKSDLTGTEA